MKWVKHNLILVVSACIFVAFLAAGGFLVKNAIGKLKDMEANLSANRTLLEQMHANKPYPSKENVELLQKDLQRFTKQYEALRDAIGKGELKVPDKLDPIVFQQSLYQKWDRLQQSAASANIKLPERFTFGFGRYLNAAPCTDAKGDECARRLRLLMTELLATEKITDVLIRSGVEDIRAVRRAEVEPNPGPDTLGALPERNPASLYETLPFEFQFDCTLTGLREVLNGLLHSEYLFIIRSLTVSTETAQEQAPVATAVNPLFTPPSAQSTSSPTTTLRHRLAVTIRIDLAEFLQPQKGKQTRQPPTKVP
ncbi:MAG: hypothetical protein ABSC38_06000 [Verrucomicrobiia bacterium]